MSDPVKRKKRVTDEDAELLETGNTGIEWCKALFGDAHMLVTDSSCKTT